MLQSYIDEMMPGYFLKRIAGDGLCIISSFKEGLSSVGREVSTEFLLDTLRSEVLQKFDFYRGFCEENVNILLELDNFLKNPLQYYNTDTCDTFLIALGNALGCKTVILQSSPKECWTVDLNKDDDGFSITLYFARSTSDHFDAVVPINKKQMLDSDSDIEIVKVVESSIRSPSTRVKSERFHSDDSGDEISIIKVTTSTSNLSRKVKEEAETERDLEEGWFILFILCKGGVTSVGGLVYMCLLGLSVSL